jgi:hypothetical protein
MRWRMQAVKFIIMQFSPRYIFLLGPNILLNTLFSTTLSLRFSLKVRDQVSHLYSTTCKITVFYILTFSFFTWDGNTKDFGLNDSKHSVPDEYKEKPKCFQFGTLLELCAESEKGFTNFGVGFSRLSKFCRVIFQLGDQVLRFCMCSVYQSFRLGQKWNLLRRWSVASPVRRSEYLVRIRNTWVMYFLVVKIWNLLRRWDASIGTLNFFVNLFLICYCRSQIFKL